MSRTEAGEPSFFIFFLLQIHQGRSDPQKRKKSGDLPPPNCSRPFQPADCLPLSHCRVKQAGALCKQIASVSPDGKKRKMKGSEIDFFFHPSHIAVLAFPIRVVQPQFTHPSQSHRQKKSRETPKCSLQNEVRFSLQAHFGATFAKDRSKARGLFGGAPSTPHGGAPLPGFFPTGHSKLAAPPRGGRGGIHASTGAPLQVHPHRCPGRTPSLGLS